MRAYLCQLNYNSTIERWGGHNVPLRIENREYMYIMVCYVCLRPLCMRVFETKRYTYILCAMCVQKCCAQSRDWIVRSQFKVLFSVFSRIWIVIVVASCMSRLFVRVSVWCAKMWNIHKVIHNFSMIIQCLSKHCEYQLIIYNDKLVLCLIININITILQTPK